MSGTKRKRWTPEEVAEAMEEAFATALGMVCGEVRQMALGEEADDRMSAAVVRAHAIHRAKVLGLPLDPDARKVAAFCPSKALARGMAQIRCSDAAEDPTAEERP